VLFTPIAISAAPALGMESTPFIQAAIFGTNCSFATRPWAISQIC
jgi:di/tricarboxylate transporter